MGTHTCDCVSWVPASCHTAGCDQCRTRRHMQASRRLGACICWIEVPVAGYVHVDRTSHCSSDELLANCVHRIFTCDVWVCLSVGLRGERGRASVLCDT